MTTNPEWVWCSADHRGRDVRIDAWPYVKGERWNSVPTQGVAPPAIYVRRDAVEAEATALRRDLDSLQGQANMHIEGLFNQSATIETLKTETTALRRERDAAVEHAAAFAEVSRIVGISYEADGRPVVPGPTDVVLAEVSEILVAANQSRELKSERDAVRRERDALRLVARRAGDVLAWVANQLPKAARYEDGYECIAALNEAIDAVSAGKGVG